MRAILTSKWTKAVVFLLCLGPLACWAGAALHNDLTANPIEFITHATGDWTLRFLLMTLAITPLRKILRLPDLIRFRRMLGLFAFFYACLHFTTYIWLDKFFDLAEMWKDVVKRALHYGRLHRVSAADSAGHHLHSGMDSPHRRPPLAATSPRHLRQRHCGVIHYYWLVKSAVIRPLAYAAILAVLLLWRLAIKYWPQPQPVTADLQPKPQRAEA